VQNKKVYFAHAYCTYQYKIEDEQIEKLRKHFPESAWELINPQTYDLDSEKRRMKREGRSMEYCKKLVGKSNTLVFSRLRVRRGAEVTSGVGIEIDHALKLGIPVYELTEDGDLSHVHEPPNRLSYDDTIKFYDEWRNEYFESFS